MNFSEKRKLRSLLKDCDYILAGKILVKIFKDAVIKKELVSLLDSYLDSPGFDTAIDLIEFDSRLLEVFTGCRPGDTFYRLELNSNSEREMWQVKLEMVLEYSAVLKKCSDNPIVSPESMLPFSKEKIKDAIMSVLVSTKEEKHIDSLETGFLYLACFFPDNEAELANSIWKEFKDTNKDLNIEEFRELIRGMGTRESEFLVKICEKIHEQTSLLQNEITEFKNKYQKS